MLEFPEEGFLKSDIPCLYKMCYSVAYLFKQQKDEEPVPVRRIIDYLSATIPDDMNITHLNVVRYLLGFGLCEDREHSLYWFISDGFDRNALCERIKSSWEAVKSIDIVNPDRLVIDLLKSGF